MANKDLTICTVSYTHKALLDLNWDFTKRLNSAKHYTWIVVENTPKDFPLRLEPGDPRFLVLPGPEKKNQKFAACYHAAEAFTLALKQVRTRFFLTLDPDLFVVRENWMDGVMSYMEKKGLAFFGAPIHPTLYHKWRYFPCTQFMMIDLNRVDRESIDFMPRYELKYDLTPDQKSGPVKTGNKSAAARIKENIRILLKRGSIISSSLDTAWQIYQKYKDQKSLYECVQPVLKLSQKPLRPRWLNSGLNRLLELALPDQWCYIPKQRDYFTQIGFKERGYFDASSCGWDETVFENRPFSFHTRGLQSDSTVKDHTGEMPLLEKAIDSFLTQKV